MAKTTGTKKPSPQSERFEQAARELGCDESEEAFNANLKKVAKHKPVDGSKDGAPPPKPSKTAR